MEFLMKSRDEDGSGPSRPERPGARGSVRRAATKPFDLWLKRGLHQMYDDIAKEPVPEDLLKLIKVDKKP